MRPRFVLHVGPNKTGSSAIQHWLAKRADQLAADGVLYPCLANGGNILGGNGNDLVALLNTPRRGAERGNFDAISSLLESYAAQAADLGCHSVLLSSEFIPLGLEENLEFFRIRASELFRPEVLAYVRDPYWWLWSAWGQAVKGDGLSEEFQAYALRNCFSYQEALTRCIQLFGNIKLLVYRDSKLIEGFAAELGVSAELAAGASNIRVNRSLTFEELEVLLVINRIFRDSALSKKISNEMLRARPDIPHYRHFDPVLASAIRDANAPFLASLIRYMVDTGVPVIDVNMDNRSEGPQVPVDHISKELFLLVVESVKRWQDEASPYVRLRRYVMRPVSDEAGYGDELPEGFNSVEYLVLNPDVLAAGSDPVVHYLSYGRSEGRLFKRPEAGEGQSQDTPQSAEGHQ